MTAKEARYIKLGTKGAWEETCLANGIIRIGYREIAHDLCAAGNWDEVLANCRQHYTNSATRFFNELKAFYESSKETIWITFSAGRMWWGVATEAVFIDGEGYKCRALVGGWRSTDGNGVELDIQKLSGRLTKVVGYRGTICGVKDFNYLLNRINGVEIPEVTDARKNQAALLQSLVALIARLPWKDFELFADLIFVSAGWRRNGVLGKTTKDIDLDMSQPVTQERALIQVKSAITQTELNTLAHDLTQYEQYDRVYLVTHSAITFETDDLDERFEVLGVQRLASLALDAGLTDWLIEKSE